jgi:HTH-type transcriptional regulator, cell division transcriptional repressor
MDTIGDRVKYARMMRELTQEQLAQAIGVKQQAIQQIESNETKRSRYLPDIADALNVRYLWLLRKSGPMEAKSLLPKDKEELLACYEAMSETDKQHFQAIGRSLAHLRTRPQRFGAQRKR